MILALEEEGHPMKRSRYTEEQIAFALRQAEGGTPVGEVCRKMGISENTHSTPLRAGLSIGGRGSFSEWASLNFGGSGNLRKRTGNSSSWLQTLPSTR